MSRRPFLLAAVLLLGAATFAVGPAAPSGAAPPPPAITATPSTGLLDGQVVFVEGDGFEPGQIVEIFECTGDSVDEQGCDPRVAFEWDADAAGHFEFDFPIDARIWLGPEGDTEYDCRTEAAGCRIGVGYILDHANTAFATIEFDADAPLLAPVAATVEPATGLFDGQAVTVHGANLGTLEEGWVFQCITGGAMRACDHDRAVRLPVAADHTIDTTYTVHAGFTSPLGDVADCRAAPGACSIVVSWGYAWVPDRIAAVPLTFAAEPTTTLPPTTIPPTTVTQAAPSTTAAGLPRTGDGSGPLAVLGLGLLAAGGLVVWLGNGRARRRTDSSSA